MKKRESRRGRESARENEEIKRGRETHSGWCCSFRRRDVGFRETWLPRSSTSRSASDLRTGLDLDGESSNDTFSLTSKSREGFDLVFDAMRKIGKMIRTRKKRWREEEDKLLTTRMSTLPSSPIFGTPSNNPLLNFNQGGSLFNPFPFLGLASDPSTTAFNMPLSGFSASTSSEGRNENASVVEAKTISASEAILAILLVVDRGRDGWDGGGSDSREGVGSREIGS